MNFTQAFEALKEGKKIKRTDWAGYWQRDGEEVIMYMKDGTDLNLLDTQDIFFTLGNIASDDWEIVDGEPVRDIQTFSFGEAIRRMKLGQKVAREGWNGKRMFIYYVAPSKIDKFNLRNEAKDVFENVSVDQGIVSIGGHIDMKAADGSIVVGWLASQTDMLATDYYEVK